MDLFFDYYFNSLSVKTDITKRESKVIYPEGSKAFKPQIPATRLAMWLNDFEFDVIRTAFQLLLKLHSHISVLWLFRRISVISKFLFSGIGQKNKNLGITENLSFFSFFFPSYIKWVFCIYFSILCW